MNKNNQITQKEPRKATATMYKQIKTIGKHDVKEK